MTSDNRRLLLSSVCKPFGASYGDGFSTRPSALWQNTWVQGVFIPETIDLHWGLDLIAANLDLPITVLHYPSLARFIYEVRRHDYDYVGISFNECTFHKMEPMVRAVRKHSPRSKIVLGGYGTTLPDEEIGHLADHICREEAIGFMRRLLDQPDRPFVHPLVTVTNKLFSLPILGQTGMIAAGLGCPNGCDFCLTSHYFKRRHIRYLDSGQDIVDIILRHRRARPDLSSFCIYDEDLLLNAKRGRELLEAMRRTDLGGKISTTIFTSMKALSHYEIPELVEMGIGAIWVGFEGQRSGYSKMQGNRSYSELVAECRRHGISIVLCMIIGFEYQTPEVIREELAQFVDIRPAFPQFMIYGPSGGTPLLQRMRSEGRLNTIYHNKALREGYSLLFDHPHISADRMAELQRECYITDYQTNGPSIFRVVESNLETYLHLKDSSERALRARAQLCRQALEFSWGAYQVGLAHAPNERVRSQIVGLYQRIEREVGPPSTRMRALSWIAHLPALLTELRLRYEPLNQPPTRINRYDAGARPRLSLAERLHLAAS